MADPSAYRDSSEVVEWQEKDPIDNLGKLAIKHNIFEESDLEKIDKEVQEMVDNAVAFADESDEPDMSELYDNIYENIYQEAGKVIPEEKISEVPGDKICEEVEEVGEAGEVIREDKVMINKCCCSCSCKCEPCECEPCPCGCGCCCCCCNCSLEWAKILSWLEKPREEVVEKVVEEVVIEILCNLYKRTKNENLVVSGGFFMNSLLNGKIIRDTPYKKLFIGGSPDDSGISIGSALYGANYVIKNRVHYNKLNHNYFGKKYSNQEVENELKLRKIPFQKIDNSEEIGAKLIYDQKIIAWFQGCSEFGERALGNRSILADPTNPNVKDLINKSIKYREGFRPFAPAVLSEYVHDMFHIPSSETAYFMEKIFIFNEKWKQKLPGVVHFDGTGRLQTVDKIVNPIFYNLIYKFFELRHEQGQHENLYNERCHRKK